MKIKLHNIFQIIFIFTILIFVYLFFHFDLNLYLKYDNIDRVTNYLLQFGLLTPFIILLIYIIFNFFGFPTLFFSVLSGYLYGMFYGFFIAWTGMAIGLLVPFLNSRYLFKSDIDKKTVNNNFIVKLESYIDKYGWKSSLITRLIFIIPFNLQNYAYGLTNLSFMQYFTGSCIGIIPITIVNVLTGHFIRIGLIESDWIRVFMQEKISFFISTFYGRVFIVIFIIVHIIVLFLLLIYLKKKKKN